MFRKVSEKELIFFTSQLALLMETGCSLTDTLTAIESQLTNKTLQQAVHGANLDVQSGKMLSTALGKYPKIFSIVYISMVRAGEMGGFLVEMLQRLIQILKLKHGLATKVKSAMAYPVVLTLMSVGVVIFMMTFVLPRFAALFEGKEAVLPITTRILIALANVMVGYWWAILIGLVALLVGAVYLGRSEAGKLLTQRLIVRMPLVGPVCRLLYASR
ncbi:MAG TPA: type II secretion system F family protein, partial [Planctomycetota bacterium]|nr:type II secretion system F family protein [Planctomycetota bacterium]